MSAKRTFDILVAAVGLLLCSPVVLGVALLLWLQDFRSPFYIPLRMARGGGKFRMMKFRSMRVDADKSGVNSTAANDPRVTKVGQFVRKLKLDEILQLWNVLKGEMSLVGPRPQLELEVSLYTDVERGMLSVSPGITDPASIVFADLGEVLMGSHDANLLYNQIVRPWKSRLALAYIEHRSFFIDIKLILLTLVALVSRPVALRHLHSMLEEWNLDPLVLRMAARGEPLMPYPPPGAREIVSAYPLVRA